MVRSEVLGPLETERLILRPQEVGDAAVFHQLWTERDSRVPSRRHILDGRPTVDDIASSIADADPAADEPILLTVVLRHTGAAIGYCGLNGHGTGSPAEPNSPTNSCGWCTGTDTRLKRAGPSSTERGMPTMRACGPVSETGTMRLGEFSPSSGSESSDASSRPPNTATAS